MDDRTTPPGWTCLLASSMSASLFQLLTFSLDIRAIILFPVKIQNLALQNGTKSLASGVRIAELSQPPLYKPKKRILSVINHR